MNLFEEVQEFVADSLNADPVLSGLCPFVAENAKTVDYEIKKALGRQGVVGLVLTPKARFQGAYMDAGLAWECDLEVDVVENPTVARGKPAGSRYVTGQDAAARLFDVLCPLSGGGEGRFSPVDYEEGEDGGLLVNRARLRCLVHASPPPPPAPTTAVLDGEVLSGDFEGELTSGMLRSLSPDRYNFITEVDVGGRVTSTAPYSFYNLNRVRRVSFPGSVKAIGDYTFYLNCAVLSSVQMSEGLKSIGKQAFFNCRELMRAEVPASVLSVGADAFAVQGTDPNGPGMELLAFKGKTLAQVQAMDNYPFGLKSASAISAEL